MDLVKQNVELREQSGIMRKDMLQLMVKFRNGNDLSDGSDKWQIEHPFRKLPSLPISRYHIP